MDLTTAAFVAIGVSLGLSGLLAAIILHPIRRVLERACSTGEGIAFWSRFTVLMLFLCPLILTLIFGLSGNPAPIDSSVSQTVLRIFTAALVGEFLTLAGIGIRIGTLRPDRSDSPASPRKSDDQWIK